MSKYIRTFTKTFEELTPRQTVHALEQLGEDARLTDWVNDPTDQNCALPLSMFMRADNSKLWSGFYGISYFSAYFIKISQRDGQTCTVGYRHW